MKVHNKFYTMSIIKTYVDFSPLFWNNHQA